MMVAEGGLVYQPPQPWPPGSIVTLYSARHVPIAVCSLFSADPAELYHFDLIGSGCAVITITSLLDAEEAGQQTAWFSEGDPDGIVAGVTLISAHVSSMLKVPLSLLRYQEGGWAEQ